MLNSKVLSCFSGIIMSIRLFSLLLTQSQTPLLLKISPRISQRVFIVARNKHFEYYEDNEAVRVDMPKENSFVRFHHGQYQFKVPSTSTLILKQFFRILIDPNPQPYTLQKPTATSPLGFAHTVHLCTERS